MFDGPWGGILGLIAFAGIAIIAIKLEKPQKQDTWPSYHQDIDLGLSKEDIIERYSEEYWIERYGKKKKKRKRKKKN
jgi:hypothetical protein